VRELGFVVLAGDAVLAGKIADRISGVISYKRGAITQSRKTR
jgi:hypothetical protein